MSFMILQEKLLMSVSLMTFGLFGSGRHIVVFKNGIEFYGTTLNLYVLRRTVQAKSLTISIGDVND
jgi:hypothetical protein